MAGDETMVYEHMLVDVDDGVATLTLNRPAQLNAMNRTLGRELHDADLCPPPQKGRKIRSL
jgi:hypothetical protein